MLALARAPKKSAISDCKSGIFAINADITIDGERTITKQPRIQTLTDRKRLPQRPTLARTAIVATRVLASYFMSLGAPLFGCRQRLKDSIPNGILMAVGRSLSASVNVPLRVAPFTRYLFSPDSLIQAIDP